MAISGVADLTGRVLASRYRVLAPIGAGASGRVYVADDVKLRRRVAVKVLHAGLADDRGFLRRFRAEAQVAASLHHANIMAVYDWGDDEMPFMVLELLQGGSLRSLLDAGARCSPAQAAHVGRQVTAALEYSHARGLVHRDIKPANLLFDEHGIVRVADFGLARALAEASWTEPAGALVGTARYAAPEQATGAPLDGRADLYVAGRGAVRGGDRHRTRGRRHRDRHARRAHAHRARWHPWSSAASVPSSSARAGPIPTSAIPTPPRWATRSPTPRGRCRRPPRSRSPASVARSTSSIPRRSGDRPRSSTRTPPTSRPSHHRSCGSGGRRGRADSSVHSSPWPCCSPWSRAAWPSLRPAGGRSACRHSSASRPTRPRAACPTPGSGSGVITRASDDPADVVIGQVPRAGEFVNDGSTVELVVSRGPPSVKVLEVANLPAADARAALEGAGFVVEETPVHDETVAAGSVISTDPAVGSAVSPESIVTLVVSDGPAPVQVPDVAGRTYDEAAQVVTSARLSPTRADDAFSSTVEAGKVIGTNPSAGTSVSRDSSVAIVVSKGPELIEVPPLVGLTLEAAQAALQARGFEVDTVSYLPGRLVRSSNPAAGSKVGRGTKVTLTF